MKSFIRTNFLGLAWVLAAFATSSQVAMADGTETLGPPSIPISQGSGAVAAGTGMFQQIGQPGAGRIDLNVPGTVVQALLYWEGFEDDSTGFDDTLTVRSATAKRAVTGTLIGGPTFFFTQGGIENWSRTYRADITDLGLIQAGNNFLIVGGMNFGSRNNGVGLLVIYDDGTQADIQLRDGNDLAFINFAPPLDTTVPQTFFFAASPEDRVATMPMFFSSVTGPGSGGGDVRPTTIQIDTGGETYLFLDELISIDGPEWGTYTFEFVIPAGATSLTVQARSEDLLGLPGTPLPASFAWSAAALIVPEAADCSGRIGDYVWYDGNALTSNNIQDGNDTGIPNVSVNLLDAAMNIIATTTTNPSGAYEFTADDAGAPLCAGDYFVDVVEATLPMGYSPVDPNGGGNPAATPANDSNGPLDGGPAAVNLPTDSSEDVTIDFGYRSDCSGEIGDYLWYDGNATERDNTQGLGDTGIEGITVILKDSFGVQIATTISGQNGYYNFSGLCAGDYIVEVDETGLPAGYMPVTPLIGGVANDSNGSPTGVNLPADDSSDETVDFGYYSDCSGLIGDFVWHDLNRDGIQQPNEPGIDGVRLVLTDGMDNFVAETTSGPNGAYLFEGLCADTYTVTIDITTVPPGFTPTMAGEGMDVTLDSNDSPAIVPLAMDDSEDTTIDFGYITPCEGIIGDYVWNDTNRDGMQGDPMDEPGFADYPVVLRDADTNEILQETTTDEFGFYQFMGLCAGNYLVEVATPAGFEPTDSMVGNPATDSNGSPAMVTLPADDATDDTIDFGFRELPRPSIDIRKQEEGPDSRTFQPGSNVTFEIVVTNTGNTTLIGAKVTDALAADCEQNPLDLDGVLSPGEEVTYSCTSFNVTSPFNNEACVSATDEETEAPVSDCDTSEVDLIDIDIRKQAEGPDTRTFASGTDVTFEIMVTNTGSVDLQNVVVSDLLAPACNKDIGFLAAGDSTTYECTIPGLDASLDNEVCVEGTESGGQLTTEDCDPSDVEIIDIDIRKQAEGPDSRNFNTGDDVTFEIMVTNTGDETLMNVMVTDPLEPDCNKLIGTMTPGATDTYECTTTNLQAGYTNVAMVTGERNGVEVTDEDPSTVAISGIDIRKQAEGPDSRTFIRGTDVTFEIMVTNTGETDLSNVAVSDPLVSDCDATIGFLAAGDSTTYSCTIVNTQGSFTNEACVTGTNGTPTPLEDCDPSDVEIIDIDIRKQAEGPDSRNFNAGDDVTFEIMVTNTGDEQLMSVTVTDLLEPDCNKVIGTMDPGATDTYECTTTNLQAGYTNVAMVTGERNGVEVTDEDPSTVAISGIDIRKQAEGPDSRTFIRGTDVTFEIMVTNTGETDLSNVAVSDPLVSDCDATIGFLAAGDSTTYSCTIVNTQGSFTNEACVTGTNGTPTPLEDCDPSDVEIIDIDIRKQAEGPDSRNFNTGDDVTFEIMVTNTGDETLMNVTVTDPLEPDCNKLIGTMTPGATDTYECTTTNLQAGYTNVAMVTGERNGVEVTDEDPSTVAISGIDIRKQAEGPDSRTFIRGTDVTFEIMVTNTGETDLSNVAVSDPLVSDCDATIGFLAAGDSTTYSCTIVNTQGSFTNEACVTGTNGTPTPLEDCDPSDVEIIDIDIRKQAEGDDTRVVAIGADVDFEIVVTNTGDEDLENVTVTDPLLPACDKSIGPLAAGDSDTYTCTAFGVMSGYNNIASVTGERNGVTVSDEDPSRIALVGIDIRKQAEGPDSRTFASGADVTFEIVVTNNGILLQNVEVTDAAFPGCGKIIGDLPTNGVVTYSCTVPNVTDSFTNEACVTGSRSGILVSDCDPSDVEIIDIDIRKQAEGPDSQTVNFGGAVTFTIVVTNTGDEDLSNVIVTDVLSPVCDRNIGDLASGGVFSYDCTVYEIAAGFENEACVAGSRNGVIVDDCDPSTVVIPQPCNLTVDKLCFLPPPPPSNNFACDKPIDSLTMIWTGQDDVTVKAWKGPVGSTLLDTITGVMAGDEVTVDGYAGSPNDVYWEIFSNGGTKLGESKFHLSCSDDDMDGPEDCGKLQGNGKDNSSSLLNIWLLEGMIDSRSTLDCTVNDDPDMSDFLQACEFTGQPLPSCENGPKPDTLTWRYDGGTEGDGDCADSTFYTIVDADGKGHDDFECAGTVDTSQPVTVEDDDGNIFVVNPGESFTVNRDDIGSMTLTQGGSVQTLAFHTSCSQPLEAQATAGALTLVALDDRTGGQEVLYAYEVFNDGPGTVTNVVVDDDKLGEIGSGFQLEADTGMTLYASAFLSATTTNTVTVTGDNVSAAACFDEDSVTVTVTEPPRSCETDEKPTSLTFDVTGSCSDQDNFQDGKAKCTGPDITGDIVNIQINKDADKIGWEIVDGDTIRIFQTDKIGERLQSTIKFTITDSDGNSQYHEVHASCSQPLAEGDLLGGIRLVEYVPAYN